MAQGEKRTRTNHLEREEYASLLLRAHEVCDEKELSFTQEMKKVVAGWLIEHDPEYDEEYGP